MLELLTGTGLASAAGLNAALPLVVLGALDRWTTLVTLPDGWAWLADGWTLGILAVLLVLDVVADKIPGADHVNDIVSTVVRPTAGGLAFGAGTSATTVGVTDPGAFVTSDAWVPVALGAAMAFAVHLAKAATRAVLNAATLGLAAPVVSTVEDVTSLALAVSAVLLPVLVVAILGLMVWAAVRLWRRRSRHGRALGRPREA